MNNWQVAVMTELHRHKMMKGSDNLQAYEIVSTPSRRRFFAHTMVGLANWMISTGRQLRTRYEVPAANCSEPPTGSLAAL